MIEVFPNAKTAFFKAVLMFRTRDVNRAAQLALPLLSFFCSVPRSRVKRLPRSGGVPRKVYFYFQILS